MAEQNAVDSLPDIPWSRRTALDPKHRPQSPDRPSSTVRREWARSPQEAFVLDRAHTRIRRLSPVEIAKIQGFETDWLSRSKSTLSDSLKAIGDAVPPPLAKALLSTVVESLPLTNRSFIEICSGMGGLSSGLPANFKANALIERWKPACEILATRKPHWAGAIRNSDARDFPFAQFAGKTGLFIGGPPCQPWSRSGIKQGDLDERDLMGRTPDFIAALAPEAFVFENVPGLIEGANLEYFEDLLERLRNPAPGIRYAVIAAVLNAADFGVPQVRRRLILIGIRGGLHRDVLHVFDKIAAKATHSSRDWVPLEKILSRESDATGWMKWPYGQAKPRTSRRTK